MLIVPGPKLRIFTDESLDQVGTPPLHLSVYNHTLFENCYFAIDASFGKLENSPGSNLLDIIEDPSGWKGKSDLIVTCAVSTFPFLTGSRASTRVALVVDTAPSTIFFTRKLGMHNHVFDAGLEQRKNLMLLTTAPIARVASKVVPVIKGLSRTYKQQSVTDTTRHAALSIQGSALTLAVRCEFTEPIQCEELSDNGKIKVFQSSPCTVSVNLNDHSRVLLFPYPIEGSTCRTRISRKQSWVEVIARPSWALIKSGYALNPFPVVLADKQAPLPWSIGRVNIDRQPAISDHADTSFLQSHLVMCFSDQESEASKANFKLHHPEAISGLYGMKQTIMSIMLSFTGQDARTTDRIRICSLVNENGKSDNIIIMNGLHHDTCTGSVLLDCFFVPMTDSDKHKKRGIMAIFNGNQRHLQTISVASDEEILWKRVLPAFVERCRFSWDHSSNANIVGQEPKYLWQLDTGKCLSVNAARARTSTSFPRSSSLFANSLLAWLSLPCPLFLMSNL